jgi:hypothetical protein
LLEVTVVGFGLTLLGYLVLPSLGSPWLEVVSYFSISIYGLAAWRLGPGTGRLWQRAGRVLLWGALMTLLLWLATLACLSLGTKDFTFFGIRMDQIDTSPVKLLYSSLLLVFSPFILARTLITLWEAGRTRLLWRLTYTYLLVSVLATLFIFPAQSIYVAVASLIYSPTIVEPGSAAQRAAMVVGPVLQSGGTDSAERAGTVLRGLLEGTVSVPMPPGQMMEMSAGPLSFNGVKRLTLLDLDGRVLASAGRDAYAVGEPLPAEVSNSKGPLLDRARAEGCANARPLNGPLADSRTRSSASGGNHPGRQCPVRRRPAAHHELRAVEHVCRSLLALVRRGWHAAGGGRSGLLAVTQIDTQA